MKCARPGCHRTGRKSARGYCRAHAYALGIFTPRIDAEPARQHIKKLQTQGMTRAAIARQAGLSESGVNTLFNSRKTIHPNTHKAILAVTPHPTGILPAIGYNRRIRALRAAGYTIRELADHTGLDRATISGLSHDKWDTVTQTTADRIRNTYNQLAHKPVRPPRADVAKYNWPKPYDWDNIDDPDEQPHTRVTLTPATTRRLNYLMEHLGTKKAVGEYIGIHETTVRHIANGHADTVSADIDTAIRHAYDHHQHHANERRAAA